MESLLLPLLFIIVLGLPLILGSRRQKRALAEAQRLHESLVNGDRVMTTSGLHATVVDTADEDTIGLEIAPGVRTTWLRVAIREKVTEDDPAVDHDQPATSGAQLAPPLEDGARTDRL
ncbi:MAG TPA: preprotein translocase subunit YajC [Pseudonocardiaceae bacterium]|jgi:preprotein translocase subunit YajC